MNGITIRDMDVGGNCLSFDLRHLLFLLGERGRVSKWLVRDLECLGDKAINFEQAALPGAELAGSRLLELASQVDQVIDGEFVGRFPETVAPWIILRAVDSSAYDVMSDDAEVLRMIAHEFRDVETIRDSTS